MRPRALVLVSSALVAAGVISACGGSSPPGNGVAARPPAAIVARARAAIDAAKSVHVSGSVKGSDLSIALDLDLLAGRGGQGEMELGGRGVRLRTIGKVVYLNASSAFWTHYAGAAAAHLLHGNWLKMPVNSTGLASVAALTDLHALVDSFVGGLGRGPLRKGAPTSVAGHAVVPVTDSSTGATLYVATTGRPYPVAFARATGGRIVFDRYNERVSLAPPPNTIDIVQLKK
jgi:hypothetical protein